MGPPDDSQSRHLHDAYRRGRALRASGRLAEALTSLEAATGLPELEVYARYELAVCLAGLRRRAEAIVHYQAILELEPNHAQVAANLAALLERENRLDEAAHWVDKALILDTANETARMTRAIPHQRGGHYAKAARELRDLVATIGHPVNLSIAWNRLGQCLERLDDWDAAFEAFSESNRILRSHHPGARPDPRGPHGLRTLARIRAWLKEEPMTQWRDPAEPDPGGIAFLVGFPRSGTTLLDRMLAAHPDIEVLEEKSLFAKLHRDWTRPGELESLAGINDAQILDARAIYRREMELQRRLPERPLVIDKLPLNLAYLFLIRRLFPTAPIIVLQRHPLDACLSCFAQAFELEASMGYFLDIGDTASYYDAVMQVAAPSMDQVENPLHTLRYEDLVEKPADPLSGLTGFLGLAMDDAMLEFHRQGARGASDTPSYQQVSQPLYTRSVGKWRHYAAQLETIRPVLRPWVERFGYALGT